VAAELSLCLPIILWDNNSLKEIDFSQLAAAYGVGYSAPGSIAAFQNAVQAALSADGPTIIHTTPQPTTYDR